MKRKGHQFKRAHHLTFRDAQERDLEPDTYKGRLPRAWKREMAAYAVIVPVQACLDDEDEASAILRTARIDLDKLQAAKALPFTGWSRTNMVYGVWRKQTRGRRFWVKLDTLPKNAQKTWRAGHVEDLAADRTTFSTAHYPWHEDEDGVQVHHWFDTYWTQAVYWIEDAVVYTATIHTHEDPDS